MRCGLSCFCFLVYFVDAVLSSSFLILHLSVFLFRFVLPWLFILFYGRLVARCCRYRDTQNIRLVGGLEILFILCIERLLCFEEEEWDDCCLP